MAEHETYMRRCLQLAENGKGSVSPNPMVGAVLVHQNRIIGEGFHKRYGEAHAEVNCINSVTDADKRLISSSTLYVSLEPCTHTGKTPPCTDLILKNNIPHVVVACSDPFEKVNGSGIELLRKSGVDVETGVFEAEAKSLNKVFFTFHEQQRPYIILKWAQTADGFIGSGTSERLRITTPAADVLVHKWRSACAAIMVGTHTAIADDPKLTNRSYAGNAPLRVVIDRQLQIPSNHHLLSDGIPTIVITENKTGQEGAVHYYQVGRNEAILPAVINLLHMRNLTSLFVEGGAATLQHFIDAELWDEVRVVSNEKMNAGSGLASPVLKDARLSQDYRFAEHNVKVYTKSTIR